MTEVLKYTYNGNEDKDDGVNDDDRDNDDDQDDDNL